MMFLMRVGRESGRRVVRALLALTGATIVSFILAGIVDADVIHRGLVHGIPQLVPV
jgi:hypothetical protein